jgi:hypothetical protein
MRAAAGATVRKLSGHKWLFSGHCLKFRRCWSLFLENIGKFVSKSFAAHADIGR